MGVWGRGEGAYLELTGRNKNLCKGTYILYDSTRLAKGWRGALNPEKVTEFHQ